jgi:HlyD family secretion protein
MDKAKNILNKIKGVAQRVWGYALKHKVISVIAGIVLVVVLILIISGISARANANSTYQTVTIEKGALSATIGATGNVRANQSAALTWQTSGTVDSVNANIGDRVAAGDILATLSQTTVSQSVALAQADLVTAQRNLTSVLQSNTQSAQAQLELVTAQKNFDSAKATLDSFLATNHGGDSADIRNAQAKVTLAKQNLQSAETWYNAVKYLGDGDPDKARAVTNLYSAQNGLKSAQNSLDYFLLKPSSRDVEEARAKLAVAQARLDDATREWDRLSNGPDPDDIAAAQARVDAAQATINMARLMAPFNGTVTEANPMVGDQVSPGTSGFRIDDLTHQMVDVQVSEVDINSVEIGQPVVITFDAVLGVEYTGKVVEVAQAASVVSGVVNFDVVVELTDADDQVKPGMTAAVTVTIQSLEDVLLVPNRAVRLVDGQRVVYVLRSGQLVEIPITLGASDNTNSVVSSGDLAIGDVLVLNPPVNFTPPDGGNPGRMFGGG